jgi:hypothetical protein
MPQMVMKKEKGAFKIQSRAKKIWCPPYNEPKLIL